MASSRSGFGGPSGSSKAAAMAVRFWCTCTHGQACIVNSFTCSACAGYDMEDAMILYRAALDQGLARGHVFETEVPDLNRQAWCCTA